MTTEGLPVSHPATQPHHFNRNPLKHDLPQEDALNEPMSSSATENVTDASTFRPLSTAMGYRIVIEFCNQCRWLHRAVWTQTELFLTFANNDDDTPGLNSITLTPCYTQATAGRWRVWLYADGQTEDDARLIWDRKTEGGFGEMKVLKQRIRDVLDPGKSLGHSDKGKH